MEKKRIDYDEINKQIGERITKVRLFLGLTKEQMAEKLDVSVEEYDGFEKGTGETHVGHIARLVKLNKWIDPDYLICGKHRFDVYAEAALRKMPEEEYIKFKEEAKKFADQGEDINYDEVLVFYGKLSSYGSKHMSDKDIRECREFTLYTDMLEGYMSEHSA